MCDLTFTFGLIKDEDQNRLHAQYYWSATEPLEATTPK